MKVGGGQLVEADRVLPNVNRMLSAAPKLKRSDTQPEEAPKPPPPRLILCVSQTNCAARHMASSIAKFRDPSELVLKVSDSFYKEWHEADYLDLHLYRLHDFKGSAAERLEGCKVLVATVAMCLTPVVSNLVDRIECLIIDEASQISDLSVCIA